LTTPKHLWEGRHSTKTTKILDPWLMENASKHGFIYTIEDIR